MVLKRGFFEQETTLVARSLLGQILVHNSAAGRLSGRIVETEAYLGERDEASHAFRGQTARNAAMFGPAGHAYVYFTYGMHYCFNVVTATVGVAEAVLIRALEPLEGLELMQARRGSLNPAQLCSGPAKLVQALGITSQDNGYDLTTGQHLFIESGSTPERIVAVPRIGITRARDLPLRFLIKDNPYVSRRP